MQNKKFKPALVALMGVFSLVFLFSPQGFSTAYTAQEDKALADFARTIGITNSMIALLKTSPLIGQVLGVSSGANPDALSIPGACNSTEECNTYCDTNTTPIAQTQCAALLSQVASSYGAPPEVGQAVANPNLENDPVAQNTASDAVVGLSNRILQESEAQAENPIVPQIDYGLVNDQTSCIANLFSRFALDISAGLDTQEINTCLSGSGSRVLGATTDKSVASSKKPFSISVKDHFLLKSAENKTIYYVNNVGLKIPKLNEKVFLSYGNKFSDVSTVSQAEIDLYPTAQYIALKGSEDVYKIDVSSGAKYKVSQEARQRMNVLPHSIMTVNRIELDSYKTGEEIF